MQRMTAVRIQSLRQHQIEIIPISGEKQSDALFFLRRYSGQYFIRQFLHFFPGRGQILVSLGAFYKSRHDFVQRFMRFFSKNIHFVKLVSVQMRNEILKKTAVAK